MDRRNRFPGYPGVGEQSYGGGFAPAGYPAYGAAGQPGADQYAGAQPVTSPFGPSPSDPTVPQEGGVPGDRQHATTRPLSQDLSVSSRPPEEEGWPQGARGRRRGGGRAGRRWSR